MLGDADHAYAALYDQLQRAFNDDLRLRAVGEISNQVRDEYMLAHKRVQAVIERVTARLEAARV